MGGRNWKHRRRNRIYRRIAVALTVALLAGQSHAFVLAEEKVDMPQTAVSSGENSTDATGGGSTDGDNTENGGSGIEQDDEKQEDEKKDDEKKDDADSTDIEDGKSPEDDKNSGDSEDSGDDGNTEDNQSDDGQDPCVCETKCVFDSVNVNCRMCAADYTACAGKVEEAEFPVDIVDEKTVSGNELELGVEALAGESVDFYEVERVWDDYDFLVDRIKYKIIGNGQVEVVRHEDSNRVPSKITIPENVSDGSNNYQVTRIGDNAFNGCESLTSIELPKSLTSIGYGAFWACRMSSIEIPNGVTSIGGYAFCSTRLGSIEIPNGVTSIEEYTFDSSRIKSIIIPDGVTSIGERAFKDCSRLEDVIIPNSVASIGELAFVNCSSLSSIEIPNGVTRIESGTFSGCRNLTSVTIPSSVTGIGDGGFSWCDRLRSLKIVVPSDGKVEPLEVGANAFNRNPDERSISFLAESGMELTDEALQSAQMAYKTDERDGNSDDNLWWGWELFSRVIHVKKDNEDWTDHTRMFGLKPIGNANAELIVDFSSLEDGEYRIYDMTDADSIIDTGVNMTINGGAAEATVDYYTITFCDDKVSYGENTPQKPQLILKTVGRVTEPADPTKEGYIFDKWVTVPEGDEEFKFETTEITAPTKIYAKWTKNTVPTFTYTVTIDVKKDDQSWPDSGRKFALTKDNSTTFVADLDAVEAGTYTIYDVTGVTADEFQTKGVNTGVTVTVTDGSAEAEINYYTATFYDGKIPYGADTLQQPQILLSGQQAVKPDDPSKAGWQFAGWKTEDKGNIEYHFGDAVTKATSIYASWIENTEEKEQFSIVASATDGGEIFPKGEVSVTKGGERTFTITPDEGYRIKTVTVDGSDATDDLKDTLARAQAGARYYTFRNVAASHTIDAEFESDEGIPGGGGDNPNPGDGDDGDNPNPGGGDDGDNPNPGGGGDNVNPGGGGNGGGNHSDGGNGSGDHSDSNGSGGMENAQVTVVSELSSAPAGNDAAGNTESAQISGGQEDGTGDVAVSGIRTVAEGTVAGTSGQASNGKEPKTGDTTHMEVYATIAMVAGLTYLLLYFMEEGRGMTEHEKDVFVAAFIRWGKKGGAFRKGCAMIAIFCLLAYYHAIGKRAGRNILNEKYLGQTT